MILVGNIFNTEVETPRLDMGSGLVLQNDNGVLKVISYKESGLFVEGNTKHMMTLQHQGSKRALSLYNGTPTSDKEVLEIRN